MNFKINSEMMGDMSQDFINPDWVDVAITELETNITAAAKKGLKTTKWTANDISDETLGFIIGMLLDSGFNITKDDNVLTIEW